METDTGPRLWRGTARFVRPLAIQSGRRDWLAEDAVRCKPVSPCNFGKCREILTKCRDDAKHPQLKATGFQQFDCAPPYCRSREAKIPQQGSSPNQWAFLREDHDVDVYVPPMTADRTQELLKLAGVPPSDEKAVAWLRAAIDGAGPLHKISKERLSGADHNDLLAGIEATAKKLTKQIVRLRRHPPSWRAFWLSSVFGPFDRV